MGARYRIKNPSLVKQAENGFTLIELLMVISLSGILFGIIFQLFHVTEISFNRGWRNSDFYQNSQKALEIISSEMKEGGVITLVDSRTIEIEKSNRKVRYRLIPGSESTQIDRLVYDRSSGKWNNVPKHPVVYFQEKSTGSGFQFGIVRITARYFKISIQNQFNRQTLNCFLRVS
ncbi:MAG TPA: prepilin-type N-terminal cleavage/methylation domain-containing protein [Bacteroidetes bacterium]|nr:hypothetical protein BMS3Bbin03_02523 [bacterium BMS3Bbin03]HDK36458.1 prepilin-type N-terminal cleavage/methylation domain-containing protein [Bacteroidota bacterium]HDZ12587.1 prepilin-type N-terminal cleavage/methylation domain-containing protein [Bacteroidota bacterium]